MRSLLAVVVVAVPMLVFSSAARAQLKSISAGISMPTPMSSASQSLNRPVGFQLEATSHSFEWMGDLIDFHYALSWQPYSVNNMTNSTLHVFNGFVGVIYGNTQKTLPFRLYPFFALDVGVAGDTLSVNGGSNTVANAGFAFAFQGVPGFFVPVVGPLSAQIEMPVSVAFFGDVLTVWNGSFSLRWAL